MQKEISLKDARLGLSFIELLHYAEYADQADDGKNRINLVRVHPLNKNKAEIRDAYKENLNRIAKALDPKYTCYKDMPGDTKSFVSHCSYIAKVNKKLLPKKMISYLQIAKEELEKLERIEKLRGQKV